MKTIGIIAALGRELKEIRNNIEITDQRTIKGYKFLEGSLGVNRIILACSSVGKVNAAICSELLISNFNTNYVINTGIAGSIEPRVELLDIVIGSEIIYHDIEGYILKGCYPFRESFESSDELLKIANQAGNRLSSWGGLFHTGRIVSGDAFVSCPEHKAEIKEKLSPLCVEMEGAAIAHCCFVNRIPFLAVRSISDPADETARENYEKNEIIAAERSGKFILEILKCFV